jgi:DNA-binding transcriptional ArsR family regulator
LNGRSDVNDQPALSDDAATPRAERVISDVESLRALSDPVRLKILETMVTAADETWTVKRIAAALGVGPTKLYHHVNILEEHGFIHVAATRVVSGIIETSYQISQLSVRLDRGLLSRGDADVESSVHNVVGVIFDSVRDEIEAGLRDAANRDDDDPLSNLVIRGLTKLSPERAVELRRRLRELLGEFDTDDPSDVEAGSIPFGYLVAVYPYPESATTYPEATDD